MSEGIGPFAATIQSRKDHGDQAKTTSAGCLRSPGPERVPPIDPFEHVAELGGRDGDGTVARCGPHEAPPFQSLRIERHAETVVPKYLQQVAAFASKYVKIASVRIRTQ